MKKQIVIILCTMFMIAGQACAVAEQGGKAVGSDAWVALVQNGIVTIKDLNLDSLTAPTEAAREILQLAHDNGLLDLKNPEQNQKLQDLFAQHLSDLLTVANSAGGQLFNLKNSNGSSILDLEQPTQVLDATGQPKPLTKAETYGLIPLESKPLGLMAPSLPLRLNLERPQDQLLLLNLRIAAELATLQLYIQLLGAEFLTTDQIKTILTTAADTFKNVQSGILGIKTIIPTTPAITAAPVAVKPAAPVINVPVLEKTSTKKTVTRSLSGSMN